MWSDIRSSYAVGWRFALAFPLVFLIPSATEFIQHVIEWRIGMFDSLEAAEALDGHPAREGFGYVKVASLMIVGLWLSRFIHSGGDRRATAAITAGTVVAFMPVVLVDLAFDAGQLALAPWLDGESLGRSGAIAAGLAVFLLASALQVLWAGWRVGVPLGDRRMGFLASMRRGLPVLPAGLAIYFAVFLPLLVIHTGLNVAMAFAGPGPLMWALFAVDSLLVSLIATALWGVYHAIYRRALARAGLPPVSI